jgi:hypothetical protein
MTSSNERKTVFVVERSQLSSCRSGAAMLGALFLAACSGEAQGLGAGAEEDNIGTVQAELGSAPQLFLSAETSLVTRTGGSYQMTLTANCEDINKITFTDTTRTVNRGASLMGWLSTGTAGYTSGRVAPPTGWAVLWGDPSSTTDFFDGTTFINQLGVPNAKFPASGSISGPMNGFIGGACIARSFDAGTSFGVNAARDCVQRKTTSFPNGTFFDGSSMTSDRYGRNYAAYNDVDLGTIDVFMTLTSTDPFVRISDPFPGKSMNNHPRLRATTDAGLLVAAQSGGTLYLARYDGGTSSGTWTTPTTVATGVVGEGTSVTLSDRSIRVGPQYSFDVGKNEAGVDEIRFVYSVKGTDSRFHMKGAKCNVAPPISCSAVSVWDTTSFGGDQWNPLVAYGVIGGVHTWKASSYSRQNSPNGNLVEVWGGRITSNGFSSSRIVTSQTPCPDLRGYWGDYDDLDFDKATSNRFVRGFVDSTNGTCTRKQYVAYPMNATTVTF